LVENFAQFLHAFVERVGLFRQRSLLFFKLFHDGFPTRLRHSAVRLETLNPRFNLTAKQKSINQSINRSKSTSVHQLEAVMKELEETYKQE